MVAEHQKVQNFKLTGGKSTPTLIGLNDYFNCIIKIITNTRFVTPQSLRPELRLYLI